MTGTAAWAMVVASQYLLGIRPDYDGLRLRPCLPSEWTGYRARRKFRGATYEIEVEKPVGICTGAVEITVDRQPVAGDLLPLAGEGEVVRVRARVG
jgi:cellobiose phosphorylase